MQTDLQIIGLSGQSGVGKDYLAQNVFLDLGFLRVALAEHAKVWLVATGKLSYDEAFMTKPHEARSLMQHFCNEESKPIYGENIWCRVALTWMQRIAETWGHRRFVITDIRFRHEVRFFQQHGGKILRVVAPRRAEAAADKMTEAQRQHSSERDLDDYLGFDGCLVNDGDHDLKTMKKWMRAFLHEWGW